MNENAWVDVAPKPQYLNEHVFLYALYFQLFTNSYRLKLF